MTPYTNANDGLIIICKHVEAGAKPDVLFGSSAATEIATCGPCADAIDEFPDAAPGLVVSICPDHAKDFGIPATLPGPLGFYDNTLTLRQPVDEAA
jgi:hypothetical protein